MEETDMSDGVSESNSHKLDKIIMILEGTGPDAPGLVHRTHALEKVIFGTNTDPGLVHKMNVVWRVHVWILCTVSGMFGVLMTEVIHVYLGKHP